MRYFYLLTIVGVATVCTEVLLLVRHWSAISSGAFWFLLFPCLVQIVVRFLLYWEFRQKMVKLNGNWTATRNQEASIGNKGVGGDLENLFAHSLFLSFLTELLLLGFAAHLFGDI